MAISADGYVALGPDDDMSWTGTMDKRIFKTLTLTGGRVLLAGSTTYNLLPCLPGRQVLRLRRRATMLDETTLAYQFQLEMSGRPERDLIGGTTVAKVAFKAGMLKTVVLMSCRHVTLGEGIRLGIDLTEAFDLRRVRLSDELSLNIYTRR